MLFALLAGFRTFELRPRTGASPQLCQSAFIKTTITSDSRQLGRTMCRIGGISTHSTDSLSYDWGRPFHRFGRLFVLDPPSFSCSALASFSRAQRAFLKLFCPLQKDCLGGAEVGGRIGRREIEGGQPKSVAVCCSAGRRRG